MNDPMNELWFKIHNLHCIYIEAEDSPDKIDYETKLGDLIREFLSIVPHSCKFHLTETALILKDSVLSNPDYSTFKLSNAWMAMHKYASNLLSQPWRREYASIKLYSGFYKHQIEPVLLGGEVMLELMGYRETNTGHLELLEPIDADKVKVVALDSLMAVVECQILRCMYEEVTKVVGSVSWKDILEAREMLAGTPELISKHLISKLLSNSRHCRSNSYGAACSSSYAIPVPCNGYGSSMPLHMNGYYCQHYGHTVPVSYACHVPSGKLVDVDPPAYTRAPSESFSRSPPPTASASSKPRDESWGYVLDTLDKPSTSSNNSKKYSTSNGDRYTDRYVNGSDSIGRSGSDPISRVHEGLRCLRLEETTAAMPRSFDEMDCGEAATKYRTKHNEHRREFVEREARTLERHRRDSERERQEREYRKRERDLMEKEKVLKSSISATMQYERELPESRTREEVNAGPSYDSGHVYAGLRVNLTPENVNQPLRVNLLENQNQGETKSNGATVSGAGSVVGAISWDCEFCTYRNKKGDICGMCSKSRNSGVELKPLESGGRQCPKCTLVNDKEARQCEACNESLENSATYI